MLFIIAIAIIFIEQLLIIKLLELFCHPKNENKLRVIMAAIILTIFSQFLNEIFSKNIIVNILPFIFVGMYSIIYLQGTLIKRIGAAILVIVNVLVVNSIFIIFGSLFNSSAYHLIYESGLLFGYTLAFANKMTLFLEYCYLKNYLSKEYVLTSTTWKLIIGILVLSFICIGLTVNEFVNYKIHAYYVGIIVITFILVNLLIFNLCIRLSKHAVENTNQKLLLESMWYENKLLGVVEEKAKEISKVNHDFRNHISTIKSLIEDGKKDSASEYLDSLSLPKTITYLHTNNPVLNHILNDKIALAKRKDITIKYEILGEVPAYLENIDISIILGNLLDNAIEGCQDVDNKFIKIKIRMDENSVIFNICNSSKKVIIDKRGKIVTTKDDKKNHGFGMDNIKAAVEKYAGDDFYSYEDGCFNHICILNGLDEV